MKRKIENFTKVKERSELKTDKEKEKQGIRFCHSTAQCNTVQ